MSDITNLIDVPLAGGGEDLLKINKYIAALKSYINVATMPTTIAIQGEWGSGKTSLMNQIRYDLCDDLDERELDAPFHGVWLNMWEYSMMKTPEEVLINVIKGLTEECTRIVDRYDTSSQKVQDCKKIVTSFLKRSLTFALKAGAVAAAKQIGFEDEAKELLNGDNGGEEEKKSDEFNEIRPSQIRDALQHVIDECLRLDHENGDTKKKGFIFFIDDLDRINPIDAVHILELLKNLFEVKNCIFVLAIDYEVVVKGLKAKFGESNQDDRAYRSFFDKIIQLPFSMPVSAYNISNFLSNALSNIGYMSPEELSCEVELEGGEKDTYLNCIENMVYWSTGANPRAIKRLLNSLLLIKIMQNQEAQNAFSDEKIKAINFGLVCIQIAYPEVYDCLLKDNNFIEWDEESAHEFNVKKVAEEKISELMKLKEFDEEWEQILYRICQKTSFLAGRAQNISRLFNTIRYIVPKDTEFGEYITRIIELSAITTVSTIDNSLRETNKVKIVRRGDDVISGIIKEILEEKIAEGAIEPTEFWSKSRIAVKVPLFREYGIRAGVRYNSVLKGEMVNRISFELQTCINHEAMKDNPELVSGYKAFFNFFGKKAIGKMSQISRVIDSFDYSEAQSQTDEQIRNRLKKFVDDCLSNAMKEFEENMKLFEEIKTCSFECNKDWWTDFY